MKTLQHKHIIKWFELASLTLRENKDYLTKLDSEIGDADHGFNMERGFNKVHNKLEEFSLNTDLGAIFKNMGMTLISSIGGASGPLYGTFFLQFGMAIVTKTELSLQDFVTAFEKGVNGVKLRGRASVGDKTMIDVLAPVADRLKESLSENNTFEKVFSDIVKSAEKSMKSTVPLIAKKGRASYLGARSVGHQDAGATSSYLILKSLKEAIEE
ncbi:dihydroxyacetone kinase subunit DhaL [Flavivirga jejuensis]|uniref:Dihydroxyacetone kinase subunit DhaL n=1 Tax=Flavivirga jejuensis TaxID=870487 RepID=A0ABT8WKL2_9FLAO|nr:dihydroxyacetone kinase subunit DhaL [Flavivirga jejuensis]MDO5973653.1 dihydroxyacetone kinase subunit DhaL [Flavivirga jejuensis]